jgi:hypothetical protein
MSGRSISNWLWAVGVAWCVGCADAANPESSIPIPDGRQFVDEVYPVLLRDCAFSSCHGSRDRFLQIVGPGRPRLDPNTTDVDDPMLYEEVVFSYERTRSMLTTGETATRSMLLMKPLEFSAGGQGHRGSDDYGRNVYKSKHDPGIQALLRWAYSTGFPPSEADVAAANDRAMEELEQFDSHFDNQEQEP